MLHVPLGQSNSTAVTTPNVISQVLPSDEGETTWHRKRAMLGCDLLLARLLQHHRDQLAIVPRVIELVPPPPPPEPEIKHDDKPRTPFDHLRQHICQKYDVTKAELQSAQRSHNIAHPRMILMYLAKRHLGLSLTTIAKALKRDHTTILSGVRKVAQRRLTVAALDYQCRDIEKHFGWGVASASNQDEAQHDATVEQH